MCYAYITARFQNGIVAKIPRKEFFHLLRSGKLVEEIDDFVFPKSNALAYSRIGEDFIGRSYRWDLIPRWYHSNVDLADLLRLKSSKAIDATTGKSSGFSSFNARLESISTLASFKKPWAEGKRIIIPTIAYRERPNMEDAPVEFKNREYEIRLNKTYCLAGIWDEWKNANGQTLLSFTIITTSSGSSAKIRGIWHERMPILFDESQIEKWLSLKTTPDEAFEMCVPVNDEVLKISEVQKKQNDDEQMLLL
jgi:putative SOS response-associated peptidase YedK